MTKKKIIPFRPQIFEDYDEVIKKILSARKNPLLILFYSDAAGRIMPYDIPALEQLLEDFFKDKKQDKFEELDVLIHTNGGDANTSYRMIQLIRAYCRRLNILVATCAHSGGTLISFGADVVEMGKCATLSPIDVQLSNDNTDPFALLSVEKYVEFLEESSNVFGLKPGQGKEKFVSKLMDNLVSEVGATNLGDLFRLRSLTEQHAKALLHNYMFRNNSMKETLSKKVLSKFTCESPTHSFLMDFELVNSTGLNVKRMEENVYKLSKRLINILIVLKQSGVICPFYPGSIKNRRPYFKIFGDKK